MKRHTPLLALLVAVAALALAACGSSSSSSTAASSSGASSSGASSSSGSGSNVSGQPLKIGTICSCSGFSSSNLAAIPQFVQAWTKYVNANGGINGHPVVVYLEDDAADATKALQAAKTLVEQDHVQAIAGEISDEDNAFQKYVEQAGVPVIGGLTTDGAFASSPDFFPTGTTAVAEIFYSFGDLAKSAGASKMALFYCAEAPVCATIPGPFNAALQNAVGGVSLTYKAKIAATAPDYTAQCLAGKQSGATALVVIQAITSVIRAIDDCVQQGWKATQVNTASNVSSTTLADSNANGMLLSMWDLPIVDTSTPGMQMFHKIISQYAPSLPKSPSYDDLLSAVMAGLEGYRQAAINEKLTPSSTPADVKAGLYKFKDETLGGISPPVTFVNNGKPTTVNCYFAEKIENKKLVLPDAATPQCVPPDKVAALYKAATGS